MAETYLILGATSGMARALARTLAARGVQLVLAGRDSAELSRMEADLRTRYSTAVVCVEFEALDFASHPLVVERAGAAFSQGLDGVVLCYGAMVDQEIAEHDFAQAKTMIDVNFTSPVSILGCVAEYFGNRGRGVIAAISSVAGDRGRQSNFNYGATKAGLSAYLAGLRNRLYPRGVHVLTIKPGFVATAMTVGRVNPNSPLMAAPERVAADIDRALRRRRDVIYAPWFWRWIMLIICAVPERIFKRLKL